MHYTTAGDMLTGTNKHVIFMRKRSSSSVSTMAEMMMMMMVVLQNGFISCAQGMRSITVNERHHAKFYVVKTYYTTDGTSGSTQGGVMYR